MTTVNHIDASQLPAGVSLNRVFDIQARSSQSEDNTWTNITAIDVNVASANAEQNEFNVRQVGVASLSIPAGSFVDFRIQYKSTLESLGWAFVRPDSLDIDIRIEDDIIIFTLEGAKDVMVEINGDKWQALHLLINESDSQAPEQSNSRLWCFDTGINNGDAYKHVEDGQLIVPSNTTVYLGPGAFLTAQVIFSGVENASIRGPGFIYRPGKEYLPSNSGRPRELDGGAILIQHSKNIVVQDVCSLRVFGFSLPVCEGQRVHIDRFRSFSGYGNGDGIDLFCCQDVLIERCFLRNSDDTIAIYGHRWSYRGDTTDIRVRNCTLLPDIAHPIQIGTHGAPDKPEIFRRIHISGIDILDHEEHQMWYQGCITLNAGDENLIRDVCIENVRVEKITNGQLINIRVMKNAMWTTAPGRGIENVTIRNVELNTTRSKVVHPSMILGFDATRMVKNISIENLRIDGVHIHDGMPKPRWYTVSDYVPMFVNEHVQSLLFK
ncbi:related to endo-polygalacturonase [Melanopsichium pennsylvanicum]|uniref:Related to endo-polygalacturonase n=2 Tax=Melanopsichium pennsylvanicum TaxID=63383 RepID=A0AAJ4XMY0_9BASI|nr:transmembrane protein [Melanopsichium pennsylvanicum 4]SNX85113.1 related to endo-polygalacturonase [Melanopsichium pennsylvanicum]